MRFLAKVRRTWLTPSQGRHRADPFILAAALSFWAFVDTALRQARLAARHPFWPGCTAPGYSRSYLAAVTALSCVLVAQHVVSSEAAADPAATAGEFAFALGAGGHTIAAYPDPPPDIAPAKLARLPRAQPVATRSGKRQVPVEAVSGIPSTVLSAYRKATETLRNSQPRCRLAMPLLAAIGKVESGHARGGDVDAAGTTRTPILGPPLNGAPGIAAIGDTDGGAHDGDTTWDRAVGPMQFIPSTWRVWASDGNRDGIGDPNNVYDATLAAGRYLCAAGRNLATSDGLRRAVLAYNHSEHYLQVVLSWMRVYTGSAVAVPDGIAATDRPTAKARTSKAPEPEQVTPRRTSPPPESTGPSSPRSAPAPQRQTPRTAVSTEANPPPRPKQRDDDDTLPGAPLPDIPPIAPTEVAPRESITLP